MRKPTLKSDAEIRAMDADTVHGLALTLDELQNFDLAAFRANLDPGSASRLLDEQDRKQRQADSAQRALDSDPNAPKPGFGMAGKVVLPPTPIPRQGMRVKVKPVRFKDEPTQTIPGGLHSTRSLPKTVKVSEYDTLVKRYNGLDRRDFQDWILEARDLGRRLVLGGEKDKRRAATLQRLVKGLRTTQSLDRILA